MKKGDVLFMLLKYSALSLLGSMFWEATGFKWPDKSTPSQPKSNPPA